MRKIREKNPQALLIGKMIWISEIGLVPNTNGFVKKREKKTFLSLLSQQKFLFSKNIYIQILVL